MTFVFILVFDWCIDNSLLFVFCSLRSAPEYTGITIIYWWPYTLMFFSIHFICSSFRLIVLYIYLYLCFSYALYTRYILYSVDWNIMFKDSKKKVIVLYISFLHGDIYHIPRQVFRAHQIFFQSLVRDYTPNKSHLSHSKKSRVPSWCVQLPQNSCSCFNANDR